jgi:glycogen synthase
VFDLIEIAANLKQNDKAKYFFEICGAGSDLEGLRKRVANADLAEEVFVLGKQTRSNMQDAFGRNHVVIVPTTIEFTEGLNKVAIEAVLAGRPCIASDVCPATKILGTSVIEIPSGNIEAFSLAIRRLRHSPTDYANLQSACLQYQEIFYDYSMSWQGVLERVLLELL